MISNNSKTPPRDFRVGPESTSTPDKKSSNLEPSRPLPDPVHPYLERPLTTLERTLITQAYILIPKALGNHRHLLYCSGIEHDDALQELVIIFIRRLRGEHPFDAMKSKLQTYLFTLTKSVLLNTIAKNRRRYGMVSIITSYQLKVIDRDEDNETLNDEFTESFNSNGSKKYNEQRLDVWDLICRH